MDFLRRFWFPLALVVVLLLALPAVAVYLANLTGLDAGLSTWLTENFALSYLIPLPAWAAWLLLLVPVLLVLLYFLKLKRKPLQVPSTFLWKKSVEDLRVNSLFQWLRNNVLLILQLAAVCLLLYALLGPRLHSRGGAGRHFILMIDNSASMAATDITPSRLAAAKDQALAEIDAANEDDVGMVLVFNETAEIRQSFTGNKGLLRQAIEGIDQSQAPTRLEDALALADSLANPIRSTENQAVAPQDAIPGQESTFVTNEGQPTEVHLYSDGRFPDTPDFVLGNLNLHYHPIGEPDTTNLAIVGCGARRDETDPLKAQVFVGLKNYSSKPAPVTVRLEVLRGQPEQLQRIYEETLTVPAAGPAERVSTAGSRPAAINPAENREAKAAAPEELRNSPGESAVNFDVKDLTDADTVLHVKLKHAGDVFPLDDEAWLVLGMVRKAQVLIVGPPNAILKAFFDEPATRSLADVTYLPAERFDTPDGYRTDYLGPARDGAFDLVIFDRRAPKSDEDMPRGNSYFIGAAPPGRPFVDGTEKGPVVKGWMTQSPFLRGLTSLYEIGIGEARRLRDAPEAKGRLIEGANNLVLLAAYPRQSFTDLVQTFPLVETSGEWNTNWPVLPSFPLFLRNLLFALGNLNDAATADPSTHPGQPRLLRPGRAVKRLKVTTPAGRTVTLDRGQRSDFIFTETNHVGLYRTETDQGDVSRFAVNLFDSDESNLGARTSVRIGAESVAGTAPGSRLRDLWKWGAAAALLLLLLEWYVYNRRVYV